MNKPTFKGFLLGATALAVTSMPAVAGQDQDQVIRELQQQLQALQTEVQTLKSQTDAVQSYNREIYRNIRRVEQAATPPKMVTSGKTNVSLSISGQVNKAVLWADDGKDSEVFIVDNDNSSTRIRFIGKGKLNEDVQIGAIIEVQHESNTSSAINAKSGSDRAQGGSVSFTERKADIWLNSKTLGKLSFGQGDPASNGSAEVDLSGTSLITYAGVADANGGQLFRNSSTGAFGISINDAHNQFDGQSRDDRVRYDTPSFAGFTVGASYITGGAGDVALRYKGKFGGTKVAAAFAYLAPNSIGTVENQYDGSISFLHSSGVNLTFSAGAAELDASGGAGQDPSNYYIKLGYQGNWSDMGKTNLSVDWGESDDIKADGDEFQSLRFAVVQNVKNLGASFYAMYAHQQLNRTGADSFDDINTVMIGSRVKF